MLSLYYAMIMPNVKSLLFCFCILLTNKLYLLFIRTLKGLAGGMSDEDFSKPPIRTLFSGEAAV